MTINFQDGSAGLFDVLGKVFHAMQTIVTASGTTVRDELEDIVTQHENVTPDDLDLNAIIADASTVADAFESSAGTSLVSLRQLARDYLIEVVHDDNPLSVKTFLTAITELRTQMIANSESFDASAVAASVAAVGSPAGNGVLVATVKRGDGLTQETAYAETITVESTFDGSTSLTVTGTPSVDQLSLSFPAGSGASTTLTVASPSSSLIADGGFDTLSTLDSNVPKGFIASVADPGVTVKMTTPEQQTVTIAGSPTAGYYLLHYTNADSKKQTTEPIAFDATATTVQTRLRALEGLESVTVSGTGTSPNFTHTITFLGAGGDVTLLTSTNRMSGGSSTNEVQTVTLSDTDGGTFTLTYDGQTTGNIDWDATASETQTALEALSNIEVGDVSCAGGPFPSAVTVTFTGALAATNVTLMTIDTTNLTNSAPAISVVETTAGSAAQNEIQTVALYGTPTGGTFTLKHGALTTAAIAYNANAAAVESALEALASIDAVTVTGGALPGTAVVIEFVGSLASTSVAPLILDPSSLTGGSLSMAVSEVTAGGTGNNEVFYTYEDALTDYMEFRLNISGTVSGGTFTLTVDSDETAAIAYDATRDEIAAAYNSLNTNGIMPVSSGNETLQEGPSSVMTFKFIDQSESDISVPTVDSTNLTGGGSYTATKTLSGGLSHTQYFGTFTLTVDGQTTTSLTEGTSPAAVQSALEALSTVGSGNVAVTRYADWSALPPNYRIEFLGSKASQAISMSLNLVSTTTGGLSLENSQAGGGGTSEVQRITTTGTPAQGTFALVYSGQKTDPIAYNASAASIESALESLSNLSATDISCTGGPLPGSTVDCTFASYLGDVNLLVMDDDLIQYSNTETQSGDPGTNEVQTVTLTGDATGGTFTLTHSASTTSAIAYNANAATVEGALDALGIANFSVTGSAGGPWQVTFAGALAATDVALITGDAALATNADPSGNVVETTAGSDGSGSISHIETVAGTTQVYDGSYALLFESDGSELTQLDYAVTVSGETAYALNLFLTVAATAGSGVIQFSLVDGISGTVINDSQGNANTISVNVSALTTSWQSLDDAISGEPIFRLPEVVPDLVYLRMRFSTAPPSGTKVYFDHLAMVAMTELYNGGPLAAMFAGNDAWRVGDKYNITVTNDRAGLLHEWMARTFDLATNQIVLPVDSGGSETIPDSVVS